MNTTPEQGVELAQRISWSVGILDAVEVVLCPPFVSIPLISAILNTTSVKLGAQNLNENHSGAFTGEVSAQMIRDFVSYVIVGHSERRAIYRETDELVSLKAQTASQAGITPIICVGEDEEERSRGRAERFVRKQIRQSIGEPELAAKAVIAYEPVWAIGTGVSASIGQIEYMIAAIREELAEMREPEDADNIRILYGGSVNPDNIAEIAASQSIDGALVGGASLDHRAFIEMIRATTRVLVSS